jgi:hypothetical protein
MGWRKTYSPDAPGGGPREGRAVVDAEANVIGFGQVLGREHDEG